MIWMLIHLAATSSLAALGDSTADLVYTPVTPCRVLDTRMATLPKLIGPIAAGETIHLSINDIDAMIPAQGGHEEGCPQAPLAPEPTAVVLTITAEPAVGGGHFRTYPFQGQPTLTSALNWHVGNTVANTTVVQTCVDCGADLSIYLEGEGATHIVVDLLGYFMKPEPTPPQINVLRTPYTVDPKLDILMYSPVCPSGYQLTGGGFHGPRMLNYGSRPTVYGTTDSAIGVEIANAWLCEGRNDTNSPLNVACYVVCAQLPGSK